MSGWQILKHSFRTLADNLDHALRLSLVPYSLTALYQISVGMNPPPTTEEAMMTVDPGTVLLQFVLGLLSLIASLWIAVGWHRFVLDSEYPDGWMPRWYGSNMLAYLGRSILIGLLMAVALMILMIPAGFVMVAAPAMNVPLLWGIIVLAGYGFFRLGAMLPAAALGQKLKLVEAWEATKGANGALFVLSLLVMGGALVIQMPIWFSDAPGSILGIVYSIVTGWCFTMISVSVLTTIYGVYIQGRRLD